MNRLTLILILTLLLSLIGVTAYYSHQAKKDSRERIEALQEEFNQVVSGAGQMIRIDSLKSAIEEDMRMQMDSIIVVYSQELLRLRKEYKYELKIRDQRIQASMDSLKRLRPDLPEF